MAFVVDLDRVVHTSELPCSDYDHFEPAQNKADFERAMALHCFMQRGDDDFLHAGLKLYKGYCGEYE